MPSTIRSTRTHPRLRARAATRLPGPPVGLALGRDVALADAGARGDPFVARVDEFRRQSLVSTFSAGGLPVPRCGRRCAGLRPVPPASAAIAGISLLRRSWSSARPPAFRGSNRRQSRGGADGSRPRSVDSCLALSASCARRWRDAGNWDFCTAHGNRSQLWIRRFRTGYLKPLQPPEGPRRPVLSFNPRASSAPPAPRTVLRRRPILFQRLPGETAPAGTARISSSSTRSAGRSAPSAGSGSGS